MIRASRLVRFYHARQRLLAALFFGLLAFMLMPHDLRLTTRLVTGWDVGTFLYVGMTAALIIQSSVAQCRHRAALYDEGDWIILFTTLTGAVASFGAIVAELVAGKAEGSPLLVTFGITGLTVALSWAFTHVTFALHYANLYYHTDDSGHHGGLQFPGQREPDYRDFLYYSFVIGCAAQTADVATVSPEMRRVTAIHCVTAFAFNSAILALMINIGAGMIS